MAPMFTLIKVIQWLEEFGDESEGV